MTLLTRSTGRSVMLAVAMLIGSMSQASTFVAEKGLRTAVKDIDLSIIRSGGRFTLGIQLDVAVKNLTGLQVDRPLRIVVKSNREVLNADGYTADGLPFVTICESECSLDPRAFTDRVGIKLGRRISFRPFGFLPKLTAEYGAFELNLLHFADIDGIGPLANARNFSGLVDLFRSEMPENTLLVSSGDNWIPGPTYSASGDDALAPFVGVPDTGRGDIAVLNALGVQASAVGNHELDEGVAKFASLINSEVVTNDDGSTATWVGAQFPYLSSNIDFGPSDAAALVVADAAPAQPNSVARSAIVEVDGEAIGLVGAASPTFPNITSASGTVITPEATPEGDFSIEALAAEIQAAVDALTAQGIDKIIVLSHMQVLNVERAFAPLLSDVDIIIGGGSNTIQLDETDVLRAEDSGRTVASYPEVFSAGDGEPVLLLNTDGDYKYLGRLLSAFDLEGSILTAELDAEINGGYATDDVSLATLGLTVTPNATVTAIIDELEGVVAATESNVFGITDVYIDGRRSTVRTEESNMGNLTADANLAYARAYDPNVAFALKNGGGIRADIGDIVVPPGSSEAQFLPPAEIPGIKPAGGISQFDISETLRFNNGLVLMSLRADTLLELFNQGIGFDTVGVDQPGRFPQVGGIRFSFSQSAAIGSRIQTLELINDAGAVTETIVSGGALQVPADTVYRFVTLDFLVSDGGQDGYAAFPDDLTDPAINFVELESLAEPAQFGEASFAVSGSEQDALAEYLRANFFPPNAAFNDAETPREQDTRIVFLP